MSNHQVCFGSKSSKSAVVQPLGFLIYEWNTAWSGLRISVRFFLKVSSLSSHEDYWTINAFNQPGKMILAFKVLNFSSGKNL